MPLFVLRGERVGSVRELAKVIGTNGREKLRHEDEESRQKHALRSDSDGVLSEPV